LIVLLLGGEKKTQRYRQLSVPALWHRPTDGQVLDTQGIVAPLESAFRQLWDKRSEAIADPLLVAQNMSSRADNGGYDVIDTLYRE